MHSNLYFPSSFKKPILFCILGLFSCYAQAQVITSFAGGLALSGGDGGPATAAGLNSPYWVATDDSGNVFITDNSNYTVRKVNPSGIISRFAGNGSMYGPFGEGGPATAACISSANGIATDATGNVYISVGGQVRKIDKSNIITTIAGNGSTSGGDGGPATAAGLKNCQGLAIDGSGNIYIADPGNNNVRKINSSGIIFTIAGNGIAGYTGDGGIATNAELSQPVDVAVDGAGNVYITDYSNYVVRKVNTSGIISTAIAAGAYGVRVDKKGNVYISESDHIRIVNPSGIINNFAGVTYAGFSGDGGPATDAQLSDAAGMDIDLCGNLYLADYGNSDVRKISGISGNTNLCTGDTTTFQPLYTGGSWGSSVPGVASVTPAGLIAALTPGTSTISYSIGLISATTTITVNPAPAPCTLTGTPYVCIMSSEVLENSATGGTWSQIDARIGVNDSLITGYYAGWDTVVYTISTACRTTKTKFPIFVLDAAECDSVESVKTTAALSSPELRIYPNPGKGLFTLLLSSATSGPVHVTITNVVGQKIKELTTYTNEPSYIKLDEGAGVYIISVVAANCLFVSKVVVE